ncbi:YcxB family protein [Neobacillus mesonae]|nr:YcxB family protein [Neobacillus mesonae]
MKMTIDFTKDDYWKLNKYVMFHMPQFKNLILLVMIVLPILMCAALKVLGRSWEVSIILGLLIGVLADLYVVFSVKLKVQRYVKTNKGLVGEHTIEVNDNGFTETTSINQTHYPWSKIAHIREDGGYFYVFVNDTQGINVPKRGFANAEEQAEFKQLVEKYTNRHWR